MVRVRGSHPLRPAFPDRSAPTAPRAMAALQPRGRRNAPGLGCSPFARRYWGNHSCFLFLRVLRCFSSPRGPPRITRGCHPFRVAGCPIREPADQRLHAPPRGFSQLAAPFVASWSQGIHRTPLTASRGPVSRVLLNLVLFRTIHAGPRLSQHVMDLIGTHTRPRVENNGFEPLTPHTLRKPPRPHRGRIPCQRNGTKEEEEE